MLSKGYLSEPKLRVVKGLSVDACHTRYQAIVTAAKARLEEELREADKPKALECRACGASFTHVGVGRPRSFCPKCYSGPGKKEYEKAYQRGYYARRKEGLSGYEKGMD